MVKLFDDRCDLRVSACSSRVGGSKFDSWPGRENVCFESWYICVCFMATPTQEKQVSFTLIAECKANIILLFSVY